MKEDYVSSEKSKMGSMGKVPSDTKRTSQKYKSIVENFTEVTPDVMSTVTKAKSQNTKERVLKETSINTKRTKQKYKSIAADFTEVNLAEKNDTCAEPSKATNPDTKRTNQKYKSIAADFTKANLAGSEVGASAHSVAKKKDTCAEPSKATNPGQPIRKSQRGRKLKVELSLQSKAPPEVNPTENTKELVLEETAIHTKRTNQKYRSIAADFTEVNLAEKNDTCAEPSKATNPGQPIRKSQRGRKLKVELSLQSKAPPEVNPTENTKELVLEETAIHTKRTNQKYRSIAADFTEVNLAEKNDTCAEPSKATNPGQPVGKSLRGRKLKVSQNYCDSDANELALQSKAPAEVKPAEKHTVCLVYDARMMLHVQQDVPGVDKCPEVPERISCIYNQFEKDNLLARCDLLHPDIASTDELELVHGSGYVNFLSNLPLRTDDDLCKYVGLESENIYFSEGTQQAIFLAAGSVMKACDSVAKGHHDKAFCLVRPPGHHAKKNNAGGFCFINNVAVAADYLLKNYPIEKILVVDLDVHHADGTQSLFYGRKDVLVVSTHSSSVGYPTGSEWKASYIGEGVGEGYNINIPLEQKFGNNDLMYVLDEIVIPVATEFAPDITLISAGFDAARGDEVGKCDVTAKGFATATHKIVHAGNGRVIMSLEGGYNLPVIAKCGSCSLRALLGDEDVLLKQRKKAPLPSTKIRANSIKRTLSRYWHRLKDSST